MMSAWESVTPGHQTGTLPRTLSSVSSPTQPHLYINYTDNIFPEFTSHIFYHVVNEYKYSEFIKVTVSLDQGCGGQ